MKLNSGILFALLLLALPHGPAAAPQSLAPVVVETGRGEASFTVELALTPAEQERGLMHRRSLPGGSGMLFVYTRAQTLGFWMKNTLIPLDIIFIGGDNRIVSISANAQPLSLQPLTSAGPARAVLEINGGLSATMGISVGDRVRHPILDGGVGK